MKPYQMKVINLFISLMVCSFNLFASGLVLVDEQYNLGIPENTFGAKKYTIPAGPSLTVDWSNYKYKHRFSKASSGVVIIEINGRYEYSTNFQKSDKSIIISNQNLTPDENVSSFEGYQSGDEIQMSIGFYDLEVESGKKYFITIWAAVISVR